MESTMIALERIEEEKEKKGGGGEEKKEKGHVFYFFAAIFLSIFSSFIFILFSFLTNFTSTRGDKEVKFKQGKFQSTLMDLERQKRNTRRGKGKKMSTSRHRSWNPADHILCEPARQQNRFIRSP